MLAFSPEAAAAAAASSQAAASDGTSSTSPLDAENIPPMPANTVPPQKVSCSQSKGNSLVGLLSCVDNKQYVLGKPSHPSSTFECDVVMQEVPDKPEFMLMLQLTYRTGDS